jgi:hypothetical protein
VNVFGQNKSSNQYQDLDNYIAEKIKAISANFSVLSSSG